MTPQQEAFKQYVEIWNNGIKHEGHISPAHSCPVCMRLLALGLLRQMAVMCGIPLPLPLDGVLWGGDDPTPPENHT
jgi:hypothetical protein